MAPTAFRREAVVWDTDRDPLDFVLRSTRALLTDLQRSGVDRGWAARDRELAELEAAAAAVAPERRGERFAIYRRVCALRRQIAFANPLLDFRRIVFAKHRLAVANHMCDQYYGNFARAGGGLFVLEEPFGRSPAVTDLLQTATVANGRLRGRPLAGGSFLQPALSYDGQIARVCLLGVRDGCGSARRCGPPTRSRVERGDEGTSAVDGGDLVSSVSREPGRDGAEPAHATARGMICIPTGCPTGGSCSSPSGAAASDAVTAGPCRCSRCTRWTRTAGTWSG